MPQTLAAWFVSIGFTAQAAAVAATITINLAVTVGLNVLAQVFLGRPGGAAQPKPEDVQQSVRQAAAPRVRHYGRVKISGPWVFAESFIGDFHKVIALGEGPFDAIEEFWIDDTQVTLDGSGVVSGGKFDDLASDQKPVIKYRRGLSTETYYSTLETTFEEWTSTHRGDGVASLYALQKAVAQSAYLDTYPNGIQTLYRVVARTSKLVPFGGGTPVWGDNAASVIYDYLIHKDGLRLPTDIVNTTEALAGWTEAYNRANENVTLKAGGTEKRYRLWGSYRLDERPAEVLSRMLSACDARLKPTPDMGLTLDIGDWAEPGVTLDEDTIIAFTDVGRGRNVIETANTIRATFTAPWLDYQTADADAWTDEDDVSERGEIAVDVPYTMSPSHGQTRRLMKLQAYRANPQWVGTFQCTLGALAAFGERFVRVAYPPFGIDEVFEVLEFQFDIQQGDTLTGVTLRVQSMPEEAYQWNAATEEGTAPVADEVELSGGIPVPTDNGRNFEVTIERRVVQGINVPVGVATFDAPPSAALLVQFEYEATSGVFNFPTTINVPEGKTKAVTGTLEDGTEYKFRLRYVTGTGAKPGPWTDYITLTPIADTTAPPNVTNVSGVGGTGSATVNWRSPNSGKYVAANIYRHTANDFSGASLVQTEFGAANSNESWQNTGLSAGTYYYWIKARNASGVESTTPVATGAVTVT